ncbi:DUF2155 domain-containing protein [Roseisalinus antarcticus]|uniref:DUF2155 domain-containing protein n=1 Tax=Roseisalinus antarcticus TaxID=254357 RepID=A0A1Y5TXB7_9RHOB|nr:DUF2155 domain-containing protein [Roseisalinus antarcticus]SLN76026.1 hypothetical protein ROA7023_04085 [Roseisalinus antarcticus]
MTRTLAAAALLALVAGGAGAQQVIEGAGAMLRLLDKQTGQVDDIEMTSGSTSQQGLLEIQLGECRYPSGNPSGDAYALLNIYYRNLAEPVFRGWMIASSPALNALDHPRYDVWVLRCTTS